MNKNTLILLAVVGLLGVGAFIATDKGEVATPKAIAVAGYASDADLDKRAQQGIMDSPVQIDYPVDEVIYTFDGQTVRLVREGTGKDVTWLIKEPVEAVAVKYQVEKMIKKFETPTTSIQSKALKSSDQVRFDLEPENRVAFTLKAGGNVWNGVDFIVGKVAKSEQPSGRQGRNAGDDADTWVMKNGEEDTVYRIAGKDLRGPFEVKLSDLRDKKVFTAKADDLVSVTIVPPNGGETVELSGDRKEQPSKPASDEQKDSAKDPEPPKFKVTWSLTKPKGIAGDKSIDAVARSLANLRTREFVPAEKGPKDGLGKTVWKLTATSHDGKTYTINVAATDGAGDDDTLVWAQVEGKKEFLKLDNYNAKNLRKSLGDLKDKSIFGAIKAEDITMLATTSSDGQNVRIAKKEGAWIFVEPAPDKKNNLPQSAEPESVLRTIATARLTRYASGEEVSVADAALAKPEFRAQLTAKGKTWWLSVGPKMDGGDLKNQRWARVQDAPAPTGKPPTPFLIQDFTASRFRKSAQDLRRKTLFDFDVASISKASVAWPDGKTNVGLAKNAAGTLEAVGLPKGTKTKASAVTTFINTLSRLRAKAFVSDKTATELGLEKSSAYVIGATLADGKSLEVWVSKQNDGTDPYATTNFGPLAGQVFTLNTYQVDNLQKELKDFQE